MFRVFAGASAVAIAVFCCSRQFLQLKAELYFEEHTDCLPNPIQCTARNALHDVQCLRRWLSSSSPPPYVETNLPSSVDKSLPMCPCPVLRRMHFTGLRCMLDININVIIPSLCTPSFIKVSWFGQQIVRVGPLWFNHRCLKYTLKC